MAPKNVRLVAVSRIYCAGSSYPTTISLGLLSLSLTYKLVSLAPCPMKVALMPLAEMVNGLMASSLLASTTGTNAGNNGKRRAAGESNDEKRMVQNETTRIMREGKMMQRYRLLYVVMDAGPIFLLALEVGADMRVHPSISTSSIRGQRGRWGRDAEEGVKGYPCGVSCLQWVYSCVLSVCRLETCATCNFFLHGVVISCVSNCGKAGKRLSNGAITAGSLLVLFWPLVLDIWPLGWSLGNTTRLCTTP